MYMLCEYSVRNKNPKSLQVVQAQSVCVCVSVCVYVCVRVCMYVCVMRVCTGVYIHAHVRFVKTILEIRTQSLCKWYKSSLCVCMCVCVGGYRLFI